MILNQQPTTDLLPLEIDASFKYRCSCGIDHWVYLREATAEGFFIVCFCNNKLYPKAIKLVNIIYQESSDKKESKKIISEQNKNEALDESVKSDIIDRCSQSMTSFGLTIKEAKEYLIKALNKSKYTNDITLIKTALLEI